MPTGRMSVSRHAVPYTGAGPSRAPRLAAPEAADLQYAAKQVSSNAVWPTPSAAAWSEHYI